METVLCVTKSLRKCCHRYFNGICQSIFSIRSASGSCVFTKCPSIVFFSNHLITVVIGNHCLHTQPSRGRHPCCLYSISGLPGRGSVHGHEVTDLSIHHLFKSSYGNHIHFFRPMLRFRDVLIKHYNTYVVRDEFCLLIQPYNVQLTIPSDCITS